MKDGNVYWSKDALDQDHVTADILAIGDSWFWYPFPGGSLITHVGRVVAPKGHVVLVAGNNGAEAYDYVKGKYKHQVRELLRLFGSTASALLISGGGNDFAGFNDLRPLLNSNCSAATTANECFKPGDAEGTVQWLFEKVFESYALLISRALLVLPANAPIIVHTYDYSQPDGAGVGGGKGWLKPALDDAKVPPALQPACIRLVIDHFHSVLQSLASSNGRIHVVDSRNLLAPSDWANELHPKAKGFRKIADSAWRPVLQGLQLA